jgi:hypothetical protein
MSFPGGSTPSPSATASSSSINTTIVASSTPQLVASSLLSSPLFPPRMVDPSLVPAAASAAFPVVLIASCPFVRVYNDV